jgi:hypothetical protein
MTAAVLAFPRPRGQQPAAWTDFAAAACEQMRNAYRSSGMDVDEFTEHLGNLCPNWAASTDVVRRWLKGSVPPADILLAATAIAAGRNARNAEVTR